MNISTNSWHYKVIMCLMNDFDKSIYKRRLKKGEISSCNYRTRVILSLFLLGFIVSGVVLIICAIGYALFSVMYSLGVLVGVIGMPVEESAEISFFVGGCIVLFGGLVFLLVTGIPILVRYLKRKSPTRSIVKSDSIVVSYIRDKKSKLCSMVTLVDDK